MSKNTSEDESKLALHQQAWNYFEMHAAQRLTTFNFYVVISSVITTALFAVLQSNQVPPIGWLLSFLLIFFSFIFSKFDNRNKDLIKGAEAAIKYFEQKSALQDDNDMPHVTQIFRREEILTNNRRKKRSILFWRNYLSYSDCFRVIFVTFGLVGLFGVVLSFMQSPPSVILPSALISMDNPKLHIANRMNLLGLSGNVLALLALVGKTLYDLWWNPRRFRIEFKQLDELIAAKRKRERADKSTMVTFFLLAVSQLILILETMR